MGGSNSGGGNGRGRSSGGVSTSYNRSSLLSGGGGRAGTGTGSYAEGGAAVGAEGEQLLFGKSTMCTEQRTEVMTGLTPQLQHLQDR